MNACVRACVRARVCVCPLLRHVCAYLFVCAYVMQTSSTPEKLADGLWNCCVPHWPAFKPHLACNLKTECASGRDEQSCPRHDACGPGGVVVKGRCYKLVQPQQPTSYYDAKATCTGLGGYVVSFNTVPEMTALLETVWQRSRFFDMHVGLTFAAPGLDPM